MTARQFLFFGLVAVSLTGLSCKWLSRKNFNVDKASPKGVYRVKVEVRVEDEDTLMNGFNEWGKIQFSKGQEVLYTNEWQRKDNWEPTFIDANPVIEWVGDNVLRMGEDTSDQPFSDEVIISNNTDGYLKHMGVSTGKYEQFDVFDIAPKKQIILRISPRFKPDGSSNHSLGYGGETRGGKVFEGAMEQKQRNSHAEGSLKFHIVINGSDLRLPQGWTVK